MPKAWPPLKRREVVAILKALGFEYSHTKGGHEHHKGTFGGTHRSVTVSTHIADFDDYLLQMMSRQAGVSRKEFYGATPETKTKIG